MCAIFGIIGSHNVQVAHCAFETLSHRGVDASYTFEGEKCFLGVHRLAVTHLEHPFTQMQSQEGVRIVFNGEIYNHQAVAKELGLGECSETEVLYTAYRQWGDNFIKHLRGMFAIAVITQAQVLLFRDVLGKKPLYYAHHQGKFIFASEMKAIHRVLPQQFDRSILPQYLSFQAPLAPFTFDKHIFQVEAAQKVVFDVGNQSITKTTYDIFAPPLPTITQGVEAQEALKKALVDAVALRIPKEVPFACLLSGGLDSSLIAAMVSKHQKVHTFSIGYEGHENYDERPFARVVASHIDSVHHEVVFDKESFLKTIDEVVALLDEPLADPAMIPLYALLKEAQKKGFKVVLTGDGSDELFMGYKTYKEFNDLEKLKALKFKGWPEHYFKSHFSLHKEWEWYKRIFEESLLFRSSAEVFTDLQQNRLLRMNVKDNHSETMLEFYKEEFAKSGRTSPVDWYSFLDLKVMLGSVFLRKLDRMSMAHSIEARSPFLDREVVDLAFSCAPELRMTDVPKELVKRVALDYLPEAIVHRKKKGFNYPYLQWLRESGELEVIVRIQAEMKLFHESELAMYLEKAKQGKFQQHIFSLYMLCKWLEHHGA